jgi:hypothetical protein
LLITSFIDFDRRQGIRKSSDNFYDFVEKLIENRGLKKTVSYIKACRLCFTRFLSGSPLYFQEGIGLNKSGLPRKLSFLTYLLEDSWGIRILLTLLTSLKDVYLPPEPKLDPITSEWKGKIPNFQYRTHLAILKELGIKKDRDLLWKKYHFSTKKGPQGQALLNAIPDLFALPSELRRHIHVLGGSPLRDAMSTMYSWRSEDRTMLDIWNTLFPRKINNKLQTTSLRKLSYFSDKEGKTRIIGILDYWSQTSLLPLHKELNSILKGIGPDCTFDQSSFLSKLPTNGPYYSFDLTNATDRLPIDLQYLLINDIIGAEKARAWKCILVDTPFKVIMPDKTSKEVKYMTGQPMGAYSSWPSMALTHHYIVRLAAHRAGITNFVDYVLLGDDIVIANKDVALKYKDVMETLDVPISEMKTHVSIDTYEFAKRWVHKGIEVTPYSLGGLLESWKKYSHFQNFIQNQHSHGWCIEYDRLPGHVISILSLLGKREQSHRILKLFMVFKSLVETKQCESFDGRLWNSLHQYFGLPQLPPERIPDLERQIIWTVKTETLENDYVSAHEMLWDIEEQYTQRLKAEDINLDDQSYKFFRKHVPIYKVVSDSLDTVVEYVDFYLNEDEDLIFNDEEIIDTMGVFTRCRKSIISGTVFSERKANVILHSSARLIKLLIAEARKSIPLDLK